MVECHLKRRREKGKVTGWDGMDGMAGRRGARSRRMFGRSRPAGKEILGKTGRWIPHTLPTELPFRGRARYLARIGRADLQILKQS